MKLSLLTNFTRLIALFILSIVLYAFLIIDLSEGIDEKNTQLLVKISRYNQMQQLAVNLPRKINTDSKSSILSNINSLANRLNLRDKFSRVNLNKNQATIIIKSASYQRLIDFLVAATKQNIKLKKMNINQTAPGLVDGQIILEK